MGADHQRAWERRFREQWVRVARKITLDFERRWGLRITIPLVGAAAVLAWLLGDKDVRILLTLLSAVGAVLVVLVFAFIVAMFAAPARIAYEQSLENDSPYSYQVGWFGKHRVGQSMKIRRDLEGPPCVEWVTGNRTNLGMDLWSFAPKALRFVYPVEKIVRRDKLPVEVKIGWRGRIVVKIMGQKSLVVDEKHTSGRFIRAEIYDEEP